MQKIYAIHKWVSLVCAVFLLLLALTGLPLLFRGEINAWNTLNMPESGGPMPMEEIWQGLPEGTAAVARGFPDKEILGVTPDASDGTLYFLVKDRGGKAARSHMRMGGEQIMYDVRTGSVFNRRDRVYRFAAVQEFMHTMHVLHVRMGMGEGGRDFLALMCALSVVSIVTGIYLYLPMMKNLAFGARRRKSSRLFWSDWHKLTSVFAGTWAVVMCVSGIFIVLYSVGMRDYHRTARSISQRRSSARRRSRPRMHWRRYRRAIRTRMSSPCGCLRVRMGTTSSRLPIPVCARRILRSASMHTFRRAAESRSLCPCLRG